MFVCQQDNSKFCQRILMKISGDGMCLNSKQSDFGDNADHDAGSGFNNFCRNFYYCGIRAAV